MRTECSTLLDRCLKLYTTLWNIWTYQQLCKKIHNLCTILHKLCTILHKLCIFFTQQLVGSYVSQCCVNFLNSGLTVYWHDTNGIGKRISKAFLIWNKQINKTNYQIFWPMLSSTRFRHVASQNELRSSRCVCKTVKGFHNYYIGLPSCYFACYYWLSVVILVMFTLRWIGIFISGFT